MYRVWAVGLCVVLAFGCWAPAWAVVLTKAVIVANPADGVVGKAATMLQEELEERSGIKLPISGNAPADSPAIFIGTVDTLDGVNVPEQPESYGIAVSGDVVKLVGRDARGAMFAAGRFIRLANYPGQTLTVDLSAPIATAPDVPIRAHQLAYRNTANTYDAWTVEMYEQYIRDLIFFGCNGVELIPSYDPDTKDGPVMTESMHAMNVKLSGLIRSYGIDVWLWSPVMAEPGEDVTTPDGAKEAIAKRLTVFKDYPAIDHLFVPGGDDGDAPAEHLVPFLKELSGSLKEMHPNAKIWISNQTFTIEENNYFFDYLRNEKPEWLTGVVYGPWTKMGLAEMRERTPDSFQMRLYPDINHTTRCQYPIPEWDPAFAMTEGREPVMPMAAMQKHIYLMDRGLSNGFGTYSDGIHDDLNKVVWSAYGWDPKTDLDALLIEYGKVWWGPDAAADVARGLKMLEDDWKGPILENTTIPETRALWENISKGRPDFNANWRAQMYLFRARYDEYVQKKAAAEAKYEKEALETLAKTRETGVAKAIAGAKAALAKADTPADTGLRKLIEGLGPVMLKSIGYQLSVKPPYLARNPERGAMLDWLDQPINDRPWLEQRFAAIQAMETEEQQVAAIDEIVHWSDPGSGGFYDNLGAVGQYKHVVRQKSWEEDPSATNSPRVAFVNYKADKEAIQAINAVADDANVAFKDEKTKQSPQTAQGRQELRMSWQSQITTQFGTPLKMRYEGLDPNATYSLKVTYAGRYKPTMTLTLNEMMSIHGPVPQPDPIWPVTYYIPQAATKSGTLDLEWDLVEGRGCMVGEVWLIKNK
ncbi:MAG: hypothetical protein AMXMBFR84_14970 [Candidatus Hydrogenedentota bacterium]